MPSEGRAGHTTAGTSRRAPRRIRSQASRVVAYLTAGRRTVAAQRGAPRVKSVTTVQNLNRTTACLNPQEPRAPLSHACAPLRAKTVFRGTRPSSELAGWPQAARNAMAVLSAAVCLSRCTTDACGVLPTRRDDPLAQPRPRGHRGSRRGITVVAARSSQWVVWLGVVPRAGVVQFFWWQMGGRAPPPCWKRRALRTQNEAAAAAEERCQR